jgi:hypothetical protein
MRDFYERLKLVSLRLIFGSAMPQPVHTLPSITQKFSLHHPLPTKACRPGAEALLPLVQMAGSTFWDCHNFSKDFCLKHEQIFCFQATNIKRTVRENFERK